MRRFIGALDRAQTTFASRSPVAPDTGAWLGKGLNIFLRECLYTVYLRNAYSLYLAERYFEVPLDSLTGTELYRASDGTLPRWKTVRGLTPELSASYQEVASAEARKRDMARIHLDAVWWGLREQA